MAASAFKSTSKRANFTTSSSSTNPSSKENDARKKIPPRRSRSVSAFSRNYPDTSIPSPPLPSVDYLNKRDNPLFCNSSPDGFDSEGIEKISSFDEVSSSFDDKRGRGRTVSRSTDSMNGKQVGMPRRVRSVSRGHYGNSESKAEHGYSLASNLRNKGRDTGLTNGVKSADLMMNGTELSKKITSSNTWSSRHPLLDPSDGASSCPQGPSWEDGISTSSYSEVEEKTIRSVFEQMKTYRGNNPGGNVGTGGIYETVRSEVRRAVSEIRNDLENVSVYIAQKGIRKKSPAIITTANVSDIPPELVNPEAIELVSDIRRVYATKLEQSQERARKLREDLAVEEQRGQELSKILKEILPDPKTAGTQKCRPRRKASNERHKMSQRLAEEAMNYFDECVSISTFDSSDFSAPEDPRLISVAANSATSSCRFLPSGGGSSASTSYVSDGRLCSTMESDTHSQVSFIHGQSDLRTSSSSDTSQTYGEGNQDNLGAPNTGRSGKNQLYSTHEPTETDGILDLRNYVKRFEKGFQKHESEQRKLRSSYRSEDYKFSESAERMLFDKVIFKNRIESGGLLLCGVRIY